MARSVSEYPRLAAAPERTQSSDLRSILGRGWRARYRRRQVGRQEKNTGQRRRAWLHQNRYDFFASRQTFGGCEGDDSDAATWRTRRHRPRRPLSRGTRCQVHYGPMHRRGWWPFRVGWGADVSYALTNLYTEVLCVHSLFSS